MGQEGSVYFLFSRGRLFESRLTGANPGLKVKRGFDFLCIKAYIRANVLWGFTLVQGKTEGNKI